MKKLSADELVGTTFYTIHRIGEYKNGGNMLLLYFAYIEQSRIQQTNKSRSLDTFMMKKMGWNKTKFYKCKKGLKELGLIDVIQSRDKKGKIKTRYVKVNFIINEQKIRSSNITYEVETIHNPKKGDSGFLDTNALSIKEKCLKNKKEEHQSKFDVLFQSFSLSQEEIEKWFWSGKKEGKRKNLETITNMCLYIKDISTRLGIIPVYSKDTINATNIMWQKMELNDLDGFMEKLKNNWYVEVGSYDELVRQDYYLPEEINKI